MGFNKYFPEMLVAVFIVTCFQGALSKSPPIRQSDLESPYFKGVIYGINREYGLLDIQCRANVSRYSYYSYTTQKCASCVDLCDLETAKEKCMDHCKVYLYDKTLNETIAPLVEKIQALETQNDLQWILLAVFVSLVVLVLVYNLWQIKSHKKYCDETYHKKKNQVNSHDARAEQGNNRDEAQNLVFTAPPIEQSPRGDRTFDDHSDYGSTTPSLDRSRPSMNETV